MYLVEWQRWKDRFQGLKSALPYAARGLLIGGVATVAAYYFVFVRDIRIDRLELCIGSGLLVWGGLQWRAYRNRQPRRLTFTFDEQSGYWTHELSDYVPNPFDPKTTLICVATRHEKDALPKPTRAFGLQVVGKIHCIVEDKFWVWQETLPWQKEEDSILFSPRAVGPQD